MEQVFQDNPKLNHCYKTSDNEMFYNAEDAKNHAKSLNDQSVETLDNPNLADSQNAKALFDLDNETIDSEPLQEDAPVIQLEPDTNLDVPKAQDQPVVDLKKVIIKRPKKV